MSIPALFKANIDDIQTETTQEEESAWKKHCIKMLFYTDIEDFIDIAMSKKEFVEQYRAKRVKGE